MNDVLDELLDTATPRPWYQTEEPNAFDAALILRAVNDYERLLRIEAAAREAFALSRPPHPGHEWYCVRPTEINALAAALSSEENVT